MKQDMLIEEFHQGHCIRAYEMFGAHFVYEGVEGVRFTVYAPHARSISVIGSFNGWDVHANYLERIDHSGVWSCFVSGVQEWDSYKYHIEDQFGKFVDKADPFAFYSETRPNNASKVYDLGNIHFSDQAWMKKRSRNFDRPVSIYEVYAGGWKRNGEHPYSYKMMEEELIPYVKEQGFTHIEMMPLNEYPFDGSWGYQASGYFSLTSRYGNPTEFASFVNACHKAGIGVIMDMVPVHFVKDDFGLRMFDGQPLFEYAKKSDAESEWGTMNFNLWSEEVRSFLISAAIYWLETYHIDGIRIDAVSNLIFWGGNKDRGTNQGALDFVKRMNYYVHKEFPEVMMIAEDSSDFAKVTASTLDGGLGFDYKWDLGWMNDTIKYYETDPYYRKWEHNKINFSMAYYYSEKFLLPLSHDENVHGKKTVVDRMFGTYDQKFSQARNLYAYMYAHPGKKLNFMGNEIATFREFDEQKELDWFLLDYPRHDAFHRFFNDLNHIYLKHRCLSAYDYEEKGYKWIDADNNEQSVYSFYREDEKEIIVCVMNMCPIAYDRFVLDVPRSGSYKEILNTESSDYEGCGMVNPRAIRSRKKKEAGKFEQELTFKLAPFACLYFRCLKK